MNSISNGADVEVHTHDHRTGKHTTKTIHANQVIPFIQTFFSKHPEYNGTATIGFEIINGKPILDLEQEELVDGENLEF